MSSRKGRVVRAIASLSVLAPWAFACGGNGAPIAPPEKIAGRVGTSSNEPSAAVDGGAPDVVETMPMGCWRGGPVFEPLVASAPLPQVTPTRRYPVVVPLLSEDERRARAEAFAKRYPERSFEIDDVGGVATVSTTYMPCAAREELAKIHYLSGNTQEIVKAYVAALVREMPDVPNLAAYYVAGEAQGGGPPRIVFRAGGRGTDADLFLFPKPLSDEALVAHYGGAPLRWTKTVTRRVQIANYTNPCQHLQRPMPCDPPSPSREIVEHPVVGERPFAKRHLSTFVRRIVKKQIGNEVELRMVATPELEYSALARDLFGSENSVRAQGENQIELVGPKTRDAITGAPATTPPEY